MDSHQGHPGKGMQKSNQTQNMEAENCESNQMVITGINRQNSINRLHIYQKSLRKLTCPTSSCF